MESTKDSAKAMYLYSVARFTCSGSAVHTNQPMLIADSGNITQVGDLKWSEHRSEIEALKEGDSAVFAIDKSGVIISAGWRVTRLPDYRTNRVVWDEHAKEHVMISNGRCVLDHISPEAYAKSHNGQECQYAPSEAIALRVFIENDKAVCAWTHRAVNPCHLRPVNDEQAYKAQFEAVFSRRRSSRFIGRV